MAELRPVTNSEIRKRAWALCRENFGKILSVTFLYSLIATLAVLLGGYLMSYAMVPGTIFLMLMVIVLPAMEVGMIRLAADIWHGQPTGVGVLLKYFRRLPRIWGISLLAMLPVLVIYSPLIVLLISGLLITGELSILFAALSTVLVPVLSVLAIWFEMRLSLAPTCLITSPDLGAVACLKTSWRASKKNAWRLFCNGFMLSLPLAISQALIEIMIPEGSAGIMVFIAGIATTLIQTLFTGYISLGEFGLAEYLLNGGDSQFPALPSADEDEYDEDDEDDE